MTPGTVVSGYV